MVEGEQPGQNDFLITMLAGKNSHNNVTVPNFLGHCEDVNSAFAFLKVTTYQTKEEGQHWHSKPFAPCLIVNHY